MIALLVAGAILGSDPSAVLHLVGRFSAAQACPISSTEALTAAHVVDVRPFAPHTPLYPYRYSTDDLRQSGRVNPRGVHNDADLAHVYPLVAFERWYEIAPKASAVGDRVTFYGYDFRSAKKHFALRKFEGKVRREVAGNLVLDEEPDFGTSGSCVFNAEGHVVAIVAWGPSGSAVVVLVTPPWLSGDK